VIVRGAADSGSAARRLSSRTRRRTGLEDIGPDDTLDCGYGRMLERRQRGRGPEVGANRMSLATLEGCEPYTPGRACVGD
jgi:hypothetical protein